MLVSRNNPTHLLSNDMHNRWQHLMRAFSADAEIAEICYRELEKLYTSPNRFYHTFAHIKSLLELIDDHQQELENPHLLQLTAWYHDAVYDPTRADNEAKSADLATRHLLVLNLPEEEITTVNRLILATALHKLPEEDDTSDNRFFLDFDLAILGAEPMQYQTYRNQIRQEYSFVPHAAYKQGRQQVLRSFLARELIYLSPHMQQQYQAQARKNLLRELEELSVQQ